MQFALGKEVYLWRIGADNIDINFAFRCYEDLYNSLLLNEDWKSILKLCDSFLADWLMAPAEVANRLRVSVLLNQSDAFEQTHELESSAKSLENAYAIGKEIPLDVYGLASIEARLCINYVRLANVDEAAEMLANLIFRCTSTQKLAILAVFMMEIHSVISDPKVSSKMHVQGWRLVAGFVA